MEFQLIVVYDRAYTTREHSTKSPPISKPAQMTTELYPNDYFGGPENQDPAKEAVKERCWLIDEIIKPQLPNILDNVEKCLEMLRDDQIFKMPISSRSNDGGNGPSVKGVVTRQGRYLLDFKAIVKFPDFHKGKQIALRMNTGTKFLLSQVQTIESNLSRILRLLEELEMIDDPEKFIQDMGKVLELLIDSINVLQNPPRKLSFPDNNNYPMKQMFQDWRLLCENSHYEISLEILLLKNELCIDFRNLEKVVKKPWCHVDRETGKSFSDKVKDKLTTNRSQNLETVLRENGVQIEEPTLINNLMMSTFNTETTTLSQAQNYLNRCVTFGGKVVIECDKLTMTTSDPFLISITTKLSALEGTVSNFYTNLKI